MSEENKILLRRYVDEPCHKQNLGALERELMSPDFVDRADKELRGTEGLRRFHKAYRGAFPDADVTVKGQLTLP
jgi:hypothetical protein